MGKALSETVTAVVTTVVIWTHFLAAAGNAAEMLSGPETVVWDSINQRYLVSNMYAPYYIVEIDLDGNYNIFCDDLDWPHGMTIVDNTLFVTVNEGGKGGVVGLDLTTGERVFERFESGWYNGLIGLTADTSGWLYLSHGPGYVYRMSIDDGTWFTALSGVAIPNGSHFDARNNRVLVPAESFQSTLHVIDAADYSVSTVPIGYGRYSCITEDQCGNFYISAFWEGLVSRFDSSFNNRQLIAVANGPEGICFNKEHSTLVVPNLASDVITFLPLDIDIWLTGGSEVEWVPFEAPFEGHAAEPVAEWWWDFGDGGTATDPAPTHTYVESGCYDVSIRAITVGGDTLSRVYPRAVNALADTLWAESAMNPDGTVEVTISGRNSVPLRQMIVPIEYSGDVDLTFESYSSVGCRTDGFGEKVIIDQDTVAKRLTFRFTPRPGRLPLYMAAGLGPIVKLRFNKGQGALGETTILRLSGYGGVCVPAFAARGVTYNPKTVSGSVSLPCCAGFVGDCDLSGGVDITDISVLIDNQFLTLTPLVCEDEGDVDFSGVVDITDLSILIDNQFLTLTPLPPCP